MRRRRPGSIDVECSDAAALRAACAAAFVAALVLPAAFAAEDTKPEEDAPPAPNVLRTLYWVREQRLPPATAVWPHPVDPDLVFVTLHGPLARTTDGGRTWVAARAEGIPGVRISVLRPCPADGSTLYAGTPNDGVFRSTDAGETFTPLGGRDAGLISPAIVDIQFWTTDPTWGSLLVSHGKAAPGLSFTQDGGKSWRAIATRDVFGRLVVSRGKMVAERAPAREPDAWSLGYSYDYGVHWSVVKSDVSPTAGVVARKHPSEVFWATVDEGIQRGKDNGLAFGRVGPPDSSSWAGVLATWGTRHDQEVICAYDPNHMGFIRSLDRIKTWTESNRGLYVGRFVKEGAGVAVNADGSRFYACVNNIVYVGHIVQEKGGPQFVSVTVDPPAMTVDRRAFAEADKIVRARRRKKKGEKEDPEVEKKRAAAAKIVDAATYELRVKLEHDEGPAAIKGVTVDLKHIGVKKPVELSDDGKHRDGEAGDGLFGVDLKYNGRWPRYQVSRWTPPQLPGRTALTISAVDAKGVVRTMPGVIGL